MLDNRQAAVAAAAAKKSNDDACETVTVVQALKAQSSASIYVHLQHDVSLVELRDAMMLHAACCICKQLA